MKKRRTKQRFQFKKMETLKKGFNRILIVVFTLLGGQVYGQPHGTSPNWTTPIMLPKPNSDGSDSKDGTGTNIIRLSNGTLIQCFTEVFPYPNGSKRIYFAQSNDDGATWSIVNLAQNPFLKTNAVYHPAMAKDTSDNIHVVWFRKVPSLDIYYAKFDKNFNLLIDTTKITQFRFDNTHFEALYITVDRKNRVHVMWNDGDVDQSSSSTYFTKIMYRQSKDGGVTWQNQIILSDTTIKKHAGFPRADLSGVEGDTLAITWRQEVTSLSNWDVWIAYSTDGGGTWNRRNVANSDSAEWDPGLVVDKNNRIHLHYHEYKKDSLMMASVEYMYSDDLGNTWSPVQTLSPPGIRSQLTVYSYDYYTDAQCICWKDERDFFNGNSRADIMCSYTLDRGNTWLGQEFVTDLDTIPVGYKSLYVGSNGTFYVTFEYGDSLGRKSIWFSKRPNSTSISLQEHHRDLNWALSLNPDANYLNFITDLGDFTIHIYDSKGTLVKVVKNEKSIDISFLATGIYTAVLYSGDKFSVKKFLVSR